VIKKGDYIRTYDGFIGKLDYIDPVGIDYNHYHFENSFEEVYDDDIKLVKKRPIDLIEVGDYVNGELVTAIHKDYVYDEISLGKALETANNYTVTLNEDIKSIVTKEQFENIEYRIGE